MQVLFFGTFYTFFLEYFQFGCLRMLNPWIQWANHIKQLCCCCCLIAKSDSFAIPMDCSHL